MAIKKLSEEELQTLKSFQEKTNTIVGGLGKIELQLAALEDQKDNFLEDFKELQKEQNKTAQELQEKYGEGNIDLEKGEITIAE
jgi:hypothetical protein